MRKLEAEFQNGITTFAELLGWQVSAIEAVTMKARGGRVVRKTPAAPGFPDLTLARDGFVMFWELKTEKGSPTEIQVRWLNQLSGADLEWRSRGSEPDSVIRPQIIVALVRPRHWEWITKQLQKRRIA